MYAHVQRTVGSTQCSGCVDYGPGGLAASLSVIIISGKTLGHRARLSVDSGNLRPASSQASLYTIVCGCLWTENRVSSGYLCMYVYT